MRRAVYLSVWLRETKFIQGMRIKATVVAYAFSVQCFENATLVAYAGLRVKYYPFVATCGGVVY